MFEPKNESQKNPPPPKKGSATDPEPSHESDKPLPLSLYTRMPTAGLRLQRMAVPSETSEPETVTEEGPPPQETAPPTESPTSETETEAPSETKQKPAGLIVEPGTEPLAPEQMTKDEFLRNFRDSLDAQLPDWLAGSGYTADSCPYVSFWFGYYQTCSAAHVERATTGYLGGTAEGVTDAHDLIPLLVERAYGAVMHWRKTGDVTGLPESVTDEPMSGSAEEELVSRFSDNASGVPPTAAAPALLRTLGPGQPLSGDVQHRMEENFGTSFGDVRVHRDSRASTLASKFHSQAFTVGQHIAFGSGKYSPGTLHGDLILAHELAHTKQQQGDEETQTKSFSTADDSSLERNADMLAASAIASDQAYDEETLPAGALTPHLLEQLEEARKTTMSGGRGLRLQRCSGCDGDPTPVPVPQPKHWWEETPTGISTAKIYVRPISRFVELQQLLRQIDVQVVKTGPEVLKKRPTQAPKNYIPGDVIITQWASATVKTGVDKIFPPGKETFVDEHHVDEVKKLVEEYRKAHPQSFSTLQGVEAANAKTFAHECILTMNSAIVSLYGDRKVATKELGDAAFKAIDALDKKGLVSKQESFEAKYTTTPLRYHSIGEGDVSLVGTTPGDWIVNKIKSHEDGIHVLALSIGNGYHSASIFARKQGTSVEMAWHDQNVGTQSVDAAEINRKIKAYAAGRFKWLVRDPYYPRAIGAPWDKDKAPPAGDPKLAEAEKAAEEHAIKDIKINSIAKLKP